MGHKDRIQYIYQLLTDGINLALHQDDDISYKIRPTARIRARAVPMARTRQMARVRASVMARVRVIVIASL